LIIIDVKRRIEEAAIYKTTILRRSVIIFFRVRCGAAIRNVGSGDSSGNCSIVVVNFVAADTCLPSCYIKTTGLFWLHYWLEFTRVRVCVLLGSRPTIRGDESL
jgi:hypothetical protein